MSSVCEYCEANGIVTILSSDYNRQRHINSLHKSSLAMSSNKRAEESTTSASVKKLRAATNLNLMLENIKSNIKKTEPVILAGIDSFLAAREIIREDIVADLDIKIKVEHTDKIAKAEEDESNFKKDYAFRARAGKAQPMTAEEKEILAALRSGELSLETIQHKLDFVEAQRAILVVLQLEQDEDYAFLKHAGDLIRMGGTEELPQDSMAAW